MKRLIILLVLSSATLLSCKKEPTTWNPDWTAPIVKGNLTINDLIPDYNIENADGYASLVFKDTAYSFKIDTLIKLPDTSLVQKTAVAFSSVSLAPGSFINNNDIDQLYDLGEISLKRVIIREGQAFIEISSPWPGKTKAVFEFPKVKDNLGNVFARTYFLEAGTIADPYIVRDTFNVADFDFDLTGATGGLANNLTANISMFSNEETASFTITNLDTVLLALSFSGLKAKYAKGYFGQYDLSEMTAIEFPQLQKISGNLNLDSLRMSLNLQNGFDLIAQAKIGELYGLNTKTNESVALTFPLFNQFLNINPASGGLYDYQPSDYYLSMNSNNSTIIPFIENLPDSIVFGYDIKINPDGNTSAGTDQFFPNSSLDLLVDAELPLHIKMADFTIIDTFDVDASAVEKNLLSGTIKVSYNNSFPLDAEVPLYLLDANNLVIDSILPTSIFSAGQYNNTTATTIPSSGVCEYIVSKKQIEQFATVTKIAISATFNTSNISFVKLNVSDSIDFTVTSNLKLKISI